MNEFELINLLSRSLPANPTVVAGVGDDCAVLDLDVPSKFLLFKTDAVVEGVHFTRETRAESIGHKALARCLSDIAAMAGTPTAALVTLGLPKEYDPERVQAIYVGLTTLAQRYDVAIVGGETTTNPERMFISIAALGTVPREHCILRSGAKAGDAIFVTGDLGGSLAGKHLEFEPRLKEAQWLAQHFPLNAMIDLSDGLAGDLPHLLRASGVGAELLSSAIPISRAAKIQSREIVNLPGATKPRQGDGKTKTSHPTDEHPGRQRSGKPALLAALSDGEDFELLFTLPGKHAVSLLDDWKKQFPELRLSCIGKITAEAGLRIRDRRGIQPLTAHGYVHFQES